MDSEDDDRGEPTCFNGEYHDWTGVCVDDTDEIDYYYCATCDHVEKPKEQVNG